MALVVQSKSSPRICQHCHHFIQSSHAYHSPDTFSLYGPILLLPQGLSICCLLCLELFSQRPACLTPSVRLSVSKYSNASRYSSATLTEELSPGILPESDTSPIHLSTIRPFSCLVFLHSSSSPCINYMSICLFQVCLFLLECNYSILHSQSLKHCLAHERIQ